MNITITLMHYVIQRTASRMHYIRNVVFQVLSVDIKIILIIMEFFLKEMMNPTS